MWNMVRIPGGFLIIFFLSIKKGRKQESKKAVPKIKRVVLLLFVI